MTECHNDTPWLKQSIELKPTDELELMERILSAPSDF